MQNLRMSEECNEEPFLMGRFAVAFPKADPSRAIVYETVSNPHKGLLAALRHMVGIL